MDIALNRIDLVTMFHLACHFNFEHSKAVISGFTTIMKVACGVDRLCFAESTKELSAESGGKRSLKSVHGTWLRAVEPEWKVDMVQGEAREWEHWYIEDWGGKLVLKARGSPNKPGQFLRAHPGGAVDLVATAPKEWEMWLPFKNGDGSWSFRDAHGSWLSAREDGSVYTVKNCDSWEQFRLEWW